MKIGIKFCGHCAPRTDMMGEYRKLCEAAPGWEFTYYMKDKEVDVLLVLNACQAQCAGVPKFAGPVVIAAPDSVDHWPVGKEDLIRAIIKRIVRIHLIGGDPEKQNCKNL